MKKILLVNSNTESAPYPVSPLGLCMLATALKNTAYEVKIFDGLWNHVNSGPQNQTISLVHVLKDFQPDVIGVSIRNIDDLIMEQSRFYIEEIEDLCITPIKKYGKGITILGGAGFSMFPIELLKRWKFDFGITGAGEESLLTLLHSIENGHPTDNIPGVLVRKSNGQITGSSQFEINTNGSKLIVPYPEIDTHLNYNPYLTRSSYPIQTKRGCVLKCLYCSYPTIEGKTYQLRTAKDVVDEIESVNKRMPNVVFEFVDSTFNHPPKHAENICREIISRGLSLKLRTMGVTPAGVTPELIYLMRQAGFVQIDCTPDSASDKMLQNLRKDFNRKKLEKVASVLKEADMPTMWFFILGGPGEDDDTLDETFDFIHWFIDERDLVHITEGLRIYPDTGLEEIAIAEGIIKKNESLLKPHFYISKHLGQKKLKTRTKEFTSQHYNCLLSADSTPSKEMIQKALEVRKQKNLTNEPMFRTLLRLRKEEFKTGIKQ
ncbi:MAG: radical SAM protein [Bacteroidetes bacterium]|nr:radical SAM protein [Bacteroidota bacterium]